MLEGCRLFCHIAIGEMVFILGVVITLIAMELIIIVLVIVDLTMD